MTESDPAGLPAGADLDDLDDLAEDDVDSGPGDPGPVDPAGVPPEVEETDAAGDGGGLRSTPLDDRVRVEAWERRLVALENRLAETRAAAAAAQDAAAAAQDAAAAAQDAAAAAKPAPVVKAPKYQALAEFVMHEFTPRYGRRRQGGRWRWCERWWEHAEAVSRLGALHTAWEAMSDDSPTGMGDWYRNHLDHQLPILMGADGPFRRCDDHHYPDDPDDALVCGIPRWDNIVWQVT